MIESIRKTVRTAGMRGLFDGITGTWMRQMSYSLCRFWAYDESKKIVGAGESLYASRVDALFGQYSWDVGSQTRMRPRGNLRLRVVWVRADLRLRDVVWGC